jgi:hypothetical protein
LLQGVALKLVEQAATLAAHITTLKMRPNILLKMRDRARSGKDETKVLP